MDLKLFSNDLIVVPTPVRFVRLPQWSALTRQPGTEPEVIETLRKTKRSRCEGRRGPEDPSELREHNLSRWIGFPRHDLGPPDRLTRKQVREYGPAKTQNGGDIILTFRHRTFLVEDQS
jgi:hypothetical protein